MQVLVYGNNLDKILPYEIPPHTCHEIDPDLSDLQNSVRHKIYDSLTQREVGESCLIGLKVLNGCHESITKFVCNKFGIRQLIIRM
jgi:hypothetical protein